MFDEDSLCRCSAALHAIDDHDVRTGVNCELYVVEYAGSTDFYVDGLFPVRDLAQLADLDGEIVRAGPVGMTARGTLIDAFRQRAHLRDPRIHLLSQQHAAAARLGALPDHDLDGIGAAHIVRIEAVA